MRAASTAAALLALALAAVAAAPVRADVGARSAGAAWRPDVAGARAAAAARPGTVSFAVRSGGRAWGWRADRVAPSRSLVKTLFLVADLRRLAGRDLGAADRARLRAMVTRSDDAAATATLGLVGVPAVQRVADRAGMRRTRVRAGIWGDSPTTAADQARLFSRVDALLPARHRAYGMRLLREVVPAQRWGIGRVGLPSGWTAAFKGGWGSGTGESDHQSVLLVAPDGRRVAASVLVSDSPSHAAGKRTLRVVFAALLRGLS